MKFNSYVYSSDEVIPDILVDTQFTYLEITNCLIMDEAQNPVEANSHISRALTHLAWINLGYGLGIFLIMGLPWLFDVPTLLYYVVTILLILDFSMLVYLFWAFANEYGSRGFKYVIPVIYLPVTLAVRIMFAWFVIIGGTWLDERFIFTGLLSSILFGIAIWHLSGLPEDNPYQKELRLFGMFNVMYAFLFFPLAIIGLFLVLVVGFQIDIGGSLVLYSLLITSKYWILPIVGFVLYARWAKEFTTSA